MKNLKNKLKEIFIIALMGFFATSSVCAQAPDKISYQAVVRSANGDLISNQPVGMKISILQSSSEGSSVYIETQNPITSTNGLFSILIGTGTTSDDFSSIDWSNDIYFIKTEIDPQGGANYTIEGTSQLVSVPYALYAKSSGSSIPGPAGADGIDGDTGPAGADGLNGIDGAVGATGPEGPEGPVGPEGPEGPAGADGTNGIDGVVGDTGPEGPEGPEGPAGVDGTNGIDGAVGDTGPEGPEGPEGPVGPAGTDGNDGAPGITPWITVDSDVNYLAGKVGIGVTNFTPVPADIGVDTKLIVAGKIHAQEVQVSVNSGVWPDYVFAKGYDLPKLEDVEKFIIKNKHLPGIDSDKEMEKKGLYLADMSIRLVQKIEELTLYTISQNNKLKDQDAKIKVLENQVKKADRFIEENKDLKSLMDRLLKVEEQLKKQN